MGLRTYLKKRRFGKTPEPRGGKHKAAAHHRLRFVVQEHHASHLHYDFRLELDGVLKSWAVPKGPSLDPQVQHLAVQTEDHPYDYHDFEGVIPHGNYGAGSVIVWDEGWYEPRADTKDASKTLRHELAAGHLTFVLHGKKLNGEFALIKMENANEDNAWLLVKKRDEFAVGTETVDITKEDESVKSGKRVDDLGGTLPDLSAYPKKAAPWPVEPMLCTLVTEPFDGDEWLFEVKWDGFRAIAAKHKDKLELYSRNHTDFSAHYPPIAEAVRALGHDVILDGEIVVVDENGLPHFELLQNWRREPAGILEYHIFDILWIDGRDIRAMPLAQRKAVLKAVLPANGPLRFSDDVVAQGKQLFQKMQEQHLEGIVAKRADSTYREGNRGPDWLKVKTHLRQEVVIGGYTEPRGGRKYLGALLVGVYDKGEFVYTGHSGGGIPDNQRKELQERLARLERKSSPFNTEPKPNAPVHWVRPELVCEMEFAEWTSEGYMRQPEFKGMRSDKDPKNVKREKARSTAGQTAKAAEQSNDSTAPDSKDPHAPTAKTSNAEKRADSKTPHTPNAKTTRADKSSKDSKKVKTAAAKTTPPPSISSEPFERTHPDKIFFPKHKYTKGDLFKYYESVADFILPYLKDRPVSLNRMPDGINGEHFFQKNNPHLPEWVPHADIFSDSNEGNLRWIVGGELETLLYMVQLGAIEINPWSSRVGHLDKPDWMVIDLDPEGVSFEKVIEIAHTVKEVCDEWNIPTHPKTSGKTGIHLFVPTGAKYTYEQVKNLAHLIVLEVNRRQPKLTSVERDPAKRPHKIYLDFLQNRESQTLAAPYSVRPTPDASVSMPLHWDEVKKGLKPSDFTIENALARLNRTHDLWKPLLGPGVNLAKILKNIPTDSIPKE